MLRYQDVAQSSSRLRALTSLDPGEFAALLPAFEACFLARMRDYTLDGLPRLNRRYSPYKNSPLPPTEDKLLFILVHVKQNLTQDIQGQLFGMIQSDANKWLQVLRPVLLQTLEQVEAVPARLATCMAAADQESMPEQPPFFIMMVPNGPSNDQ